MVSAFISYSWDSEQHKKWVKELAAHLRVAGGIKSILDQWELVPGDRLTAFMETAIRENDYVVIVCTPPYQKKVNNRTGGSGYEGDIMTGEVFTGGNVRKFVPILRDGDWRDAAPSWLLSR